MRKIPSLELDDQKVFDDIAAAKRQPRQKYLKAIRANVLLAYSNYKNAAPDIGNLPAVVLTALQSKALIHAFEVETAPMLQLRCDLFDRVSVARCPFCGISESSTLDHYLPNELNPQFAIFSKNLVPCCGICNTRKRDLILDENNAVRLFLHPYFDNIPQARFIEIDVNLLPNAMTLRYRLVRPTGVKLREFKQLKSHFQLLGLADRYRRMSLEHLRTQYVALARLYGNTGRASRVEKSLSREAKRYEENYGNNYWLTVLYYTLAYNNAFCNGGVGLRIPHVVSELEILGDGAVLVLSFRGSQVHDCPPR